MKKKDVLFIFPREEEKAQVEVEDREEGLEKELPGFKPSSC